MTFVNGTAQELPFKDAQFDIVVGTLMLHHLPSPFDRPSSARRHAS